MAVPAAYTIKLLGKDEIVRNVWHVVRLLFNADYQVRRESFVRDRVGGDLMGLLIWMQGTDGAVFAERRFVGEFLEYVDTHIRIVSPDYDPT